MRGCKRNHLGPVWLKKTGVDLSGAIRTYGTGELRVRI